MILAHDNGGEVIHADAVYSALIRSCHDLGDKQQLRRGVGTREPRGVQVRVLTGHDWSLSWRCVLEADLLDKGGKGYFKNAPKGVVHALS